MIQQRLSAAREPLINEDKHLLLVDDDAELRREISEYLEDFGFSVHVAADTRAMDEVLSSRPIDLIILDLMLPGEDGLSAGKRLAAAGGPAVIMASAAGDEVNRVLGFDRNRLYSRIWADEAVYIEAVRMELDGPVREPWTGMPAWSDPALPNRP